MKIGIVSTWFERGAAYVSKQYRDTWLNSHEVFIYVRGGEQYALNDKNWNVPNLTWGHRSKFFQSSDIDLVDFSEWIKANNIEVVFFNEQQDWKVIGYCAKLSVKIGAYIDYYTEETVPLFLAYDFLICNTARHYSVFNWHPQCYYIPWGTDLDLFSSTGNVEKRVLTFFHSAGMNPFRKGTDLLIKAFNQIRAKNVKLLIHTQVAITEYFPELSADILTLIEKGTLEIITKSVPAPGLYHLGDVYIYPSRLDGIGLTVAEALASGLPVITTNEAPMNEFVKEGLNGKLLDISKTAPRSDGYYWNQVEINVDSLRESIEYYINNSADLQSYKVAAIEYASSFLDWKINSRALNQIIPSIVKLDKSSKHEIVERIKRYEKARPLTYYIHTFRPFLFIKKRLAYWKSRFYLLRAG